MMNRIVYTPHAPQPIGPYSQAVACGSMLYISGQIPLDPERGTVVGDSIGEQAEQALANLRAILESEELTVANVVKTMVFLTNMNNFTEFNNVYENTFCEHRPARSVVAVAALPKNVLIEIEAVACR